MSERDKGTQHTGRKPWWSSKLLISAIVVTVAGAGMWVYAAATRPAAESGGGGSGGSGLVMGLTGGEGNTGAEQPPARLIDDVSPAMVRLGLSFVVGFVIGFVVKKVLKVAVLVALIAGVVIAGLHYSGVMDGVDREAVKGQVDQGIEWVKTESSAFRQFSLGLVPSGAAAVFGAVVGALRG